MEYAHPNSTARGPLSNLAQKMCVVSACDKKINQKCACRACAGHCRLQGGCSIVAHGPESIKVSQTLPATLPPQQNISTWGISNGLLSAPWQDPRTPTSQPLSQPPTPAMQASVGNEPPPLIPPLPIQSIPSSPRREPMSLNPLPNACHASQIQAIFTPELAQKQELLRMQQIQQAEWIEAVNWAAHAVTVRTWLSVGLL